MPVKKLAAAPTEAGGESTARHYEAYKKDYSERASVKVTVQPYFKPRHSAPDDHLFTFGYKVEFENTGSQPITLHSRHWHITDAAGNEFEVAAPTIAGKVSTPLKPKKLPFSYETAVPLSTPGGRMKGFFTGNIGSVGEGRSFRTPEVEFEFSTPSEQLLKECVGNHANADFIKRTDLFTELPKLRRLFLGYASEGRLDTRDLGEKMQSTRAEFERLLLCHFLVGYGKGSISLSDIHRSFPATVKIWDMGFIKNLEGEGIYIFKNELSATREHKNKENQGSNVLPFPCRNYSAVQTVGVVNDFDPSHAVPPEGRGDVNKATQQFLAARKIPRAMWPATAAEIERVVRKQVAADTTPPLAAALETMTLQQRRDALDRHYAARKKNTWTKARSAKPTPEEFLAWLDATFPDRREIGMMLPDLKHLDKRAFDKLNNWSGEDSGVSKATIDGFGLPPKKTKYYPERDATAPKSLAEVYERAERGEDSFKNLNRAFNRAQYHRDM